MTGKNRRTKRSDDSSSDDSDITKRLQKISHVKLENKKKLKQTKKVLDEVCDDDSEDSEKERKRLNRSRPFMTALPIAAANKFSKQNNSSNSDSSDSDSSDSDSSDSDVRSSKAKDCKAKNKTQSKNVKKKTKSSSDFDSSHEKIFTGNKRRHSSEDRTKRKKRKMSKNKESDSSSGKEFQKPKVKKRGLSKLSVGELSVKDDYTIVDTPCKSDDENIQVDKKQEISLKHYVLEAVGRLQKMVDDLKTDLECQSDYLINKKVNVVRDSKFIAHKILRVYDSTYEKIKDNRNSFTHSYKSWLETCNNNSNKASNKSLEIRYLFPDESEAKCYSSSKERTSHDDTCKSKSSTRKSLKENVTSDSDSEPEANKIVHKRKPSIHKENIDFESRRESLRNKSPKKSEDSDNSKEKKKPAQRKKSLNLSKDVSSEDASSKENESSINKVETEINIDNQKKDSSSKTDRNKKNLSLSKKSDSEQSRISNSKTTEKSNSKEEEDALALRLSKGATDSEEEQPKTTKSNSGGSSDRNDSAPPVSECDSDQIFSDKESSPKKNKDKSKESSSEKDKPSETEQEEEDPLKDVPDPIVDKPDESISEDLFESSVSEVVENTPVKSPILSKSKSLRKTLLLASQPNDIASMVENEPMLSDAETQNKQPSDSESDPKPMEVNELEVEAEAKSEVEAEAESGVVAAEDLERQAFKKLLQDWDSDQSTYHASNDEGSLGSVSSSCSTVDVEKRSSNSFEKLAGQPRKLIMIQTKKQNSIYSGSSSDDNATEERAASSTSRLENGGAKSSLRRKPRRRAFDMRKNRHYKTDKKLRMVCRVKLQRLSHSVLKKYARALEKSKRYVANKKLNSMINLDGLESKKKSRKALDSGESTDNNITTTAKAKKKSKNEKKSLKDHLDETNDTESGGDASDNTNDNDKKKSLFNESNTEKGVVNEVEEAAKEALLNSSSSSYEEESAMDVDESTPKKSKTAKSKNAKKDDTNVKESTEKNGDEKMSESEESADKKKEKSSWKKDKLLTFNLTDTESEEEKVKKKSQEKKKAKKEEQDMSLSEDVIEEISLIKTPAKKKSKSRKTRRILDSEDSDANNDSSEESASNKESESEEEKKVDKKKKSNKRKKSSESDTSSSEKKSKSKRKRIKKVATDSESDQDSPTKGRKNIRKVLKDKHVADDTKKAAQDEEERLRRIAERQRLFNEMYDARLAGEAKVDKLVLDIDEETKEELVVVNEELVKRLKPHQAQGIKFMWDACFESLKQIEKSEGSGCIIAHCMGLGKTFQVVTLAHTLLSNEETGVRTVMVVCPLSTVLNWVNEFKTWLKHVKNSDDIEIYELTKLKKNVERKYMLESWQKTGGVLIIGYEMFRNLTSTGKKMRKAMQESIMRSLVDPGADLVVCDEGHLLKNEDSALSKAMKLVKTMRRIVLTGTPLQNNLKEYHCMVQFVKPNLLGTKKEFLNRFVNPITNGQFDDSTPYDVKLMKKRAHVLHKMLEGSVQRFDYSVLTPFLPPKQEYVIFVRLTEVQIKMYQHYIDNFARRFGQRNGSLFADFQELQRIWTHPYVLRLNAEKVEKANEKKRLEASTDSEGSLKNFIDDDSDSEASTISSSSNNTNSDVQCIDSDKEKLPTRSTRNTRANIKDEPEEIVPNQETAEEAAWWSKFVEEEHFEDLRISTKLTLLFGILKESEQIGDKVLVFSQSLYSLTLIEQFLNLIDQETQEGSKVEHLDNHTGNWQLGLDYFRLDGSTSAENRSAWCKIFNNPNNTRARLFLISTRAGGLGINLTAANRVIIFDASWNPSHDVQSIFRIYRFGQKKPCYVYRFLAAGTMEEKIYNRQVTKLSLACRVVDEQQIERHYSNNDLAELYQFDSYEGKSTTLNLPKDRLLAEIFLKYKNAVYTYHEHDSLLENKQEEELDEEERKQAWLEYEEEKQGKRQMMPPMNNMGNNLLLNQMLMNVTSFPEFENIKLLIQKDYPNLPPEHLDTVARQAMYDMYRFVDQQAVSQLLNPFAAGTPMQPPNLLGAPVMTHQQQQYNQQNQLMNMLTQPQINYPAAANQMPAYSGRGRPPKHLSMNNPMQATPMQLQQPQIPQMNNNDVEILDNRQVTPPNTDSASNINDKQKE